MRLRGWGCGGPWFSMGCRTRHTCCPATCRSPPTLSPHPRPTPSSPATLSAPPRPAPSPPSAISHRHTPIPLCPAPSRLHPSCLPAPSGFCALLSTVAATLNLQQVRRPCRPHRQGCHGPQGLPQVHGSRTCARQPHCRMLHDPTRGRGVRARAVTCRGAERLARLAALATFSHRNCDLQELLARPSTIFFPSSGCVLFLGGGLALGDPSVSDSQIFGLPLSSARVRRRIL